MDKTQRRLFTGARDGSIKVWNMVNGCNIQNYSRISDNEITSIVYIDQRKLALVAGWSRKIVSYFDEPQEVNFIKIYLYILFNKTLFSE
jgi:WD40 repeat protein